MLWTLTIPTALATWSVVAVDPETREVGVAGATCGPFVWFIAGLAPGEGAVASQYATWIKGKRQVVDDLDAGRGAEAALERAQAADAKPELRQWGIVDLEGGSVGATGAEVEGEHAAVQEPTFSVQGNTLASERVVLDAADTLRATEGPLADRLLRALEAGAAAGGDHRCDPSDAARSAFLYVARPGDDPKEPTIEYRAAGRGAVARLRERYDQGRAACQSGGGAPSLALSALTLLLARRRR